MFSKCLFSVTVPTRTADFNVCTDQFGRVSSSFDRSILRCSSVYCIWLTGNFERLKPFNQNR